MRCISGYYTPDAGEITVDGQPLSSGGPKRAAELGIEIVHQDLSLVMHGDVVQNLYLNREIRSSWAPLGRLGWLDKKAMRAGARAILDQVGIGGTISVRQRVQDLSGGQRQCIAIGRAVGWSRRMVFLDEPTAALGVRQTRHVLDLIGRLRAQGIAIVLISSQHGAGVGGLRSDCRSASRSKGCRSAHRGPDRCRWSSGTSPAPRGAEA